VFTTAADLLRDRKYEFAAALSLENGKNRTEAMADVDEAIDSSSPTASRIPIGS
jgi:1-pyrroline-5-carboxylate dehydrogenase